MAKSRKYADQDFINAVEQSSSTAQVLSKLGLRPTGGNYSVARKRIKDLDLSTFHFSAQAWSKGVTFGPKRPIEDYLNNLFPIGSDKLRKRLISEGFFESKCYSCHSQTWLGKPIALELEHINGNNKDNSLVNLTLLCPNCHAQTSTYRGKNKGKYS